MRLLIVEDNAALVENLYGFFEPLGYTLDYAQSGYAGLALVAENSYDAIVLDVMLPGLDGFTLCEKIRAELQVNTPVIMLTAKDTVENRVTGLDAGADDYLIKPFSMVELDARIRALVRRASQTLTSGELRFGPLRICPQQRKVYRGEDRVPLTPTGFALILALMKVAPAAVSRAELEHAVWGDKPPATDALRAHMHTLRQAIDKPFPWPCIQTVQGFGYRLEQTRDA